MASDSDTRGWVAFVAAVAFLAFIAGALSDVAGVGPSGYIRDAYRAGLALMEKRSLPDKPYPTDLWREAQSERRGVTVHDEARASAGFTLYTSGHAPAAFLMASDGRIVHRWERPYSTVHDASAAVRDPVPDRQVYFRRAHLLPDGDLIAAYTGAGDSPWGYGLVRLSADSAVVWKNLDHFHHDFDLGPNGAVYGLTHRYRSDYPEILDHLGKPVLDDYLTVVAPDGRTQRRISLLEALADSPYKGGLWILPVGALEDPLHTNAVDVLDAADARRLSEKIPAAAAGQVLLSFRAVAGGLLALLDVDSGRIVWAQHGQWRSQHDPDILANGNLMLFDNLGHQGPGGRSRVIEVDPATGGIVWRYTGHADKPLFSGIRSAQQPLANGNVLITESNTGRLLEVTRSGDIVWEYINPVRGGSEDEYIPVVSWGQRIAPADLDTAFRTRIANDPVARQGSEP
jgi:hypothetical protein